MLSEQSADFNGLNYYPENKSLQLEVQVEEFAGKERMEMQTTTGDVQVYERFGRFHFIVDGVDAELTLYHGPHGFFLPFVDSAAEEFKVFGQKICELLSARG